MKIYGAGMAGLLAGHMLRRFEPEIHEAQFFLPNNHEAILRFRTDAVSIATAIPFRKVRVTKQIFYDGEVIASNAVSPFLANMYSLKVIGRVMNRSINNLKPVERWIAPPDFIQQLAKGLNIICGSPLTSSNLKENIEEVKISTVPMPIMKWMLETLARNESYQPQYINGHEFLTLNGVPITPFNWAETWNVVVDLSAPEVDVFQTIYFPDPYLPYYRASLVGSRLIIEFINAPRSDVVHTISSILNKFGINHFHSSNPQIHYMKYGKIAPVADDVYRKMIIRHATERYNCFSLGRFGTWRQLLLDDLVNDVKVIERLIDADPYTRAQVEVNK